jgi:hypothetical protein
MESVMKNTVRTSQNTVANAKKRQERSESPKGFCPRVLLEPKCVEAVKLISECENISVVDLYDAWIRSGIENSHSSQFRLSVMGDAGEKENTSRFLPRLNKLLGPAKSAEIRIQGLDELENAITAAKGLLQLFFEVIQCTDNTAFTANNGHLAAGIQELMWDIQKRLTKASNGVRIGF